MVKNFRKASNQSQTGMPNKLTPFVLLLLLVTQGISAAEWFKNGDLHSSTLAQWSEADETNKLATSSDWLTGVLGENAVADMNLLKSKSEMVVVCIDTLLPVIGESYNLEETESMSVAALCVTKFEENGWK